MKLIAGLGNPGAKYSNTRHNIGFMIADYFAAKNSLEFKPGKGEYYFARGGKSFDNEFYILKPTTYMNDSGIAILDFMEQNQIQPEELLVVYDDFNLPLGTIRLRRQGTDGGHNGISSIIYHLQSMNFNRMRIGIGIDTPLKKEEYIDFVLNDFTKFESGQIKEMMPVYSDCLQSFLNIDFHATMNNFNKNFLKKE
jgi:peptidyl-tRNA hydrolase, PTH1 family